MSVTLFSTNCPMCKVLKKKLDDKQIQYELIDDTKIMLDKGFLSAPQLQVGDSVYDFNSARKLVDSFSNCSDISFEEFTKCENKKA